MLVASPRLTTERGYAGFVCTRAPLVKRVELNSDSCDSPMALMARTLATISFPCTKLKGAAVKTLIGMEQLLAFITVLSNSALQYVFSRENLLKKDVAM